MIFEDSILQHKLYKKLDTAIELLLNSIQSAVDENRKLSNEELLTMRQIAVANLEKDDFNAAISSLKEEVDKEWWYYYGEQVINVLQVALKQPFLDNNIAY